MGSCGTFTGGKERGNQRPRAVPEFLYPTRVQDGTNGCTFRYVI